jgi:hypothetical protein
MHSIEPHFRWRDVYVAEEDKQSPFYGRVYSEFNFTNLLYNFYVHPQWDEFGSSTLYAKILYADYDDQFVLIELMGEWNDALHNDIMYLKRNIIEHLYHQGIVKFVFFCEHVLNFHADRDDDYYAEWSEEVHEEGGWIAFINTRQHVMEEMQEARMQRYSHFGPEYNDVHWHTQKPLLVFQIIDAMVSGRVKRLTD